MYKSTGNVEAAREMYAKYSEVKSTGPHPFASWRPLILERKQPRKIFVQSNTVLNGKSHYQSQVLATQYKTFRTGEDVKLVEYEASPAGMITSWKERISGNEVYEALEALWQKDKPFF